MLYLVGPLEMHAPGGLNPQHVDEEYTADFAVKAVVGAQPNREFVGQGDTRFSLGGTIYPYRQQDLGVGSGLAEVELLKSMVASGEPVLVIRGDGENLGWFVIDKYSLKSDNLHYGGKGRQIDFQISMVSSPVSGSEGGISSVLSMLFQ